MKFDINLQPANPINRFILEVEFMHGDAEGYTTKEIDCGIDVSLAVAPIEFFSAHLGTRDYGYSEQDFHDLVPHDVSYGYDYNAYTEDLHLFWYNSTGAKYEVNFK